MRYAFRDHNMNRVWLEVLADNARAIRAYRTCGFVEEGRLRQHAWHDGAYKDVVVMGVLRAEWPPGDHDGTPDTDRQRSR